MSRVLITGSNSGFGRLAALGFARAGHHVVATMRNLDKGEALRKDAATEGLAVEVRRLDVCDPASVSSGVGDPGELDVIVNNAGFEVQGSLALVDDDLLRRQLDTNVGGPLRLIRTVLPAWSARGSGTIVNVTDLPEKFHQLSLSDLVAASGSAAGTTAALSASGAMEPLIAKSPMVFGENGIDLNEMVSTMERNMIMQALEKAGGVRSRAAQLLGLNRTTLLEKMKKMKIEMQKR